MSDVIRIGADPEFFIQKHRHFISAHMLPFGTKEKPMETDNGAIQIDGMALECNVRPAESRAQFIQNVRGVINDLQRHLYDYEPRAKIAAKPSVFFGHKFLNTLPPLVVALGCNPDYNAYTGEPNPPPPTNLPFRTGAGHVHISWTSGVDVRNKEHQRVCRDIVRELDYYLGLPSLLWDKDNRRRELYGKAGAYRPKPYGLEYRVLSNKWCTTDKHIGWVFDRTREAVSKTLVGTETRLFDVYSTIAKDQIDQGKHDWPERFPGIATAVLR